MPSKSISYVGYQSRTVTMTVEQISQDISANTSLIQWTLTTTGGSSSYYFTGIKAYVAGQKVYDKEQSYTVHSFPSGRGSVSGTMTIPHNSLGEGSVSFSMSAAVYSSTYHTYSDTLSLDTIPRVSELELSTYSLYAGQSITADTVRYNQSFIDEIHLYFGEHLQTLYSDTPFTIPLSWLDTIPNSSSGTATVIVSTYNDDVLIGERSVNITIYAPSSALPTINSVTYVDRALLPNAFSGKVVQQLSRLGVTVSASAQYGASISDVTISVDGADYHGLSEVLLNPLKQSGTVNLTATVTDSRGISSASYTLSITVYAYSPPQMSNTSITMSGTTAAFHGEGDISPVNNTNTKRLTVKYHKSQDTNWTTAFTLTGSQIAYSFSIDRNITNLDETATYVFRATLEDAASDAGLVQVYTWSTSTGVLCVSYHAGGDGVALFKEATRPGLDINGNMYINGTINGGEVYRIETGIATMPYTADVLTTVDINFSHSFASAPSVFVSQIFNNANLVVLNEDITQSKFTVRHIAATGTPTGSRQFKWVAIGK